ERLRCQPYLPSRSPMRQSADTRRVNSEYVTPNGDRRNRLAIFERHRRVDLGPSARFMGIDLSSIQQ
ncbi:hypothetical protein, partial [Caballeronia terrestris]|uniref:hypothetical protein n=1 Tax=Caballeronia terrestris TaxID=1226301 RepID=UPI001F375778